jgi:hypothetical protein
MNKTTQTFLVHKQKTSSTTPIQTENGLCPSSQRASSPGLFQPTRTLTPKISKSGDSDDYSISFIIFLSFIFLKSCQKHQINAKVKIRNKSI